MTATGRTNPDITDAELHARLTPYLWEGVPYLPGFQGRASMHGRRGPSVFIVTIDHDGQVELSLTRYNPNKRAKQLSQPVSRAMAEAFYRGIDVVPWHIGERLRATWHSVLRRGTMQ